MPEPPETPIDVVAAAGLERIELEWRPPRPVTRMATRFSRATSERGPYASIYSTTRWTTPKYTDTDVEAGKTYFYQITALNNAGSSTPSETVTATPGRRWSPADKMEGERHRQRRFRRKGSLFRSRRSHVPDRRQAAAMLEEKKTVAILSTHRWKATLPSPPASSNAPGDCLRPA